MINTLAILLAIMVILAYFHGGHCEIKPLVSDPKACIGQVMKEGL